MKVFLDSSALVKRYIKEEGSARVSEVFNQTDKIAVCIICITETFSACNRLLREKKTTDQQYKWIKNEFLLDIKELIIIDLSDKVISRSVQCLEKGVLRSLDAIHIAAAIEFKSSCFLSGDRRQKDIAAQMGLNVEIV